MYIDKSNVSRFNPYEVNPPSGVILTSKIISPLSGFTLIETLVYIALLGLLMGGTLMAVYEILQGSSVINTKATVQDEGNFVLRKIDWAFSGASDVAMTASTLTVSRHDGNTVYFQLNGGIVEMRESAIGPSYIPITTSNVQVTNLDFQPVGLDPKGVSAAVSIKTTNSSALDFTTTKYIRQ